ncbi:MAG: hypothetical protein WA418_14480 [Bradyrhizobium sp.]
MNTPDLVNFPEARRMLSIGDNRALKAACRRFDIRWIELNSRVLALRRSDIDLLLHRAANREAA